MVGVFDPSYYTVNGKLVQSPAARLGVTLLGESLFEGIYLVLKYFWITFMGIGFLTPIVFVTYNFLWAPIQRLINKSGDSDLSFSFLGILGKIETKSAKLLYLSLIVPLLLVVMQMSNPSTFSLLNNFEGLRMASAIIIVLMMTVYSLYLQVKESNPDKPEKWIFGRVNHMFWLHTLQALILSIFVIDVMLRAQVGISTFAGDSLFAGGIARSIRLEVPGFDVVIMPIFTIALTYLTMFVGFFVNRIFNR